MCPERVKYFSSTGGMGATCGGRFLYLRYGNRGSGRLAESRAGLASGQNEKQTGTGLSSVRVLFSRRGCCEPLTPGQKQAARHRGVEEVWLHGSAGGPPADCQATLTTAGLRSSFPIFPPH